MKLKAKTIMAPVLALAMTGCMTTPDGAFDASAFRQNANIGCGLAALAGSMFGNDAEDRIGMAVLTGAVCRLGAELVALQLSKQDKDAIDLKTTQAVMTGQEQTYSNPETGVASTVRVVDQRPQSTAQTQVAVLKDRVEKTPPLELVKAPYEAVKTANVRGGPGQDYKKVSSLASGEVREVIGKVQNAPWYLISEGGAGSGYVYASLLQPSTKAAAQTSAVGDVASVSVPMQTNCRTVERKVSKDGKEPVTQNFQMCQKPDGSWNLA
ncbi:MAG: SH3 domain-containing protein [Pseudomonadota bacterium]